MVQDRAHEIAGRAEARQQNLPPEAREQHQPPEEQNQQRQPVWRRNSGPLTEAESRRLSDAQQRAFEGR